MTVRSSYALDRETADNIEHLARAWGVSRAEVIRRSIRRVAAQEGPAAMTPAEAVARYATGEPVRSEAELAAMTRKLRDARRTDEHHRPVRS